MQIGRSGEDMLARTLLVVVSVAVVAGLLAIAILGTSPRGGSSGAPARAEPQPDEPAPSPRPEESQPPPSPAAVSGRVVDPEGLALPGATVTATRRDQAGALGTEVVADEHGAFRFPAPLRFKDTPRGGGTWLLR